MEAHGLRRLAREWKRPLYEVRAAAYNEEVYAVPYDVEEDLALLRMEDELGSHGTVDEEEQGLD